MLSQRVSVHDGIHDAVFPRVFSLPACLQSTPCARADEFAVAAPSFWTTLKLTAGSELGLGIDVHGIHMITLAARFRTAARSNTLADCFAKIQAARTGDRVILHAFSTAWEKAMLHRSMAYCTMEACRLDRSGAVM